MLCRYEQFKKVYKQSMNMDQKPTGTIIFSLLLLCLNTCMCYVFNCPYSHTLEWRLRAQIICNGSTTTRYQCLFNQLGQYTTKNHNFTEQCTENADFLKQGKKYVIASRRRGINCPSNTYQPLRFWSNSSDECEFVKSKCSEVGQTIYSDGSTDTDTTCRCDYRYGYAFITNPAKACYCVPSKEDCSCYLKICTDRKKVSQDYICVDRKDEGRMSICPPFLSQRNKEQEKILQEQSNTEIDKPTIDKWNWFSPTVPILLTTICFMIMGILICFEKLPDCSLVELSPVMKFSTRANTSDKCIDLTWSQPLNVKIKKYEIQYTCGVWKNFQSLDAYPPNLSEQIFDIIPKKEYRFRACYIYSCHSEDIRSDLSEDQIYSDEPAMPGKMPPVWKDGKIILFWSPPADTLFATTNYGIQITIDEWATMIADLEQPAKLGLKYNVENIKKSEMYRFKIYTSTKFGMSKPVDNFFYTGVCYSIGIPIDQNYNDALNNRDSVEYNEKSNAVHSAIEDTYQSELGKGEQKVKDVSFVENSRIAVVIFISNGYYDEVKLREVIENSVKSGTLGDLKTFYEGFSFTVLNKPEPPQDIRIVVEKSCVVLMWAKPEKSLFEKESYIIEYTTCTSDVWQTIKVEHKPDDMYAVKITDVLPSSKYKFRLSTIIHDSIASHQSTENEITMGDPLPLCNLKVAVVKSVQSEEKHLKITWDKPVFPSEKHIQEYKLIVNEKEFKFKPGTECSYTWKPVDTSKVYTFALIAHDFNGTESKSDTVTCNMQKTPLPPRNISVVQNNAGIELFWEHPHTIQLHCIQHYTIYIKEDGVHPLKPVIVLSPQRSQLIVNLKPKHRYTFKVSTCSTGNFEGEVSVLIESTSGDTTVGSQ